MQSEEFTFLLKAKIETLFNRYKDKLPLAEQREIVKNGFVFSKVDPKAEILVMGINPSLRTDFLENDGESYAFAKAKKDRYFKKFHKLLSNASPLRVTYCDLFYQRHTEQKQIEVFLKDAPGKLFLQDQLQLTNEVIAFVKPKIILLFNRKAASFLRAGGLDYTLEAVSEPDIDNVYWIVEQECYLYLSTFLGYRTPKKALDIVQRDIPELIAFIKTKQESS